MKIVGSTGLGYMEMGVSKNLFKSEFTAKEFDLY